MPRSCDPTNTEHGQTVDLQLTLLNLPSLPADHSYASRKRHAGEFVARYVAASAKGEGITWAVAGRSQAKLDKVVAGLGGWPNTASAVLTQPTAVIIADVVSWELRCA